jgi:predicted phage terminase large subunit-like protein
METVIRPQPGPQEEFVSCWADIVIYGGAAGGGKSFGLLITPLRWVSNPQFGAVLFRRTTVQLKSVGGLWDESEGIYPYWGARGFRQSLEWRFPSGAKIKMSHMEHEKNRLDWQGSQIAFIGWDEITHFTGNQFWYLVGRNRSMSGVPGRIRCTCNPDPDSFVAELIKWWIDQQTGYPIPGRAGVIKWFVRLGDEIVWGFSKRELIERYGAESLPMSLTFIPSNVFDNKLLLAKDPGYLAKLRALPLVEREQMLKGNWKVRPAAGMYFKRHYFGIVEAAPAEVRRRVRYWDRAATEKRANTDPDSSVGVLMSQDKQGVFYVEDVQKLWGSAHKVEQAMKNTAALDGKAVQIGYMQDPGSAGKGEAEQMARELAGWVVKFAVATGDKETRAKPASSQAEAGNIKIVRAHWNEEYLRVLENFPEGLHDDEVDATSGAFELLIAGRSILVA